MVKEVDRRSVLKRVGAAGAVGAGLATGTASACGGNELIEMPPAEMAEGLDAHATGVMEELSDEGLIEAPIPAALPLEPMTVTEMGDGVEGAVPVRLDGSDTIVVQKSLGDAWLRVFTDISESHSYALYDTLDDMMVEVIAPDLRNEVDLSDSSGGCPNECLKNRTCSKDDNSGLWEMQLKTHPRGTSRCAPVRPIWCECKHIEQVPLNPRPRESEA